LFVRRARRLGGRTFSCAGFADRLGFHFERKIAPMSMGSGKIIE
jgi:hypothetical protein